MAYLGGHRALGFTEGAQGVPFYDPVMAELMREAVVGPANFHEMAALVRYAEARGVGPARFRLDDGAALADPLHPLHLAFLETLRDPVLCGDYVELGDVGPWRARALGGRLPSDMLGSRFDRGTLIAAVTASGTSPEVRVALCVAGRIRFGDEIELLGREAQALYEMGLFLQARARLAACVALGGDAIAIG